MKKYFPQDFEHKWVEAWDKDKTYQVSNDVKKAKMYTLVMFPYPSGAGLHVGHVRIYTGGDVLARYFRMKGYDVLNPMGFDAFGLPAENAAIKAKKNPMDMVPENIANFKRQMKMMGLSFDWNRSFSTTDPKYYGITQELFQKFFKLGLLYKKLTPVFFCPFCKTGLSEEEVLPNSTHERCGKAIEKRDLPQWNFKITEYAQSLLDTLNELEWPEGIVQMQKNWIGKKEGMKMKHEVVELGITFETFSAYPAWSFADTFIVIAPEHPLVKELVKGTEHEKEVNEFIAETRKITAEVRNEDKYEKKGVFTGRYAKDPFGGPDMPIWLANFALMDFGTGIIRCSAHDPRDYEFAKKYNIPLKEVVERTNPDEPVNAHTNAGVLKDSGPFTGKKVEDSIEEMKKWIVKEDIGKVTVNYHLRDWIFSRQRYWGEPIPMVYCEKCARAKISFWDTDNGKSFEKNYQKISKVNNETKNTMFGWFPIDQKSLPLELPYMEYYEPTGTGESPLATAKDWVQATCPNCGGPAKRETDTMPNWAGSCWYFLAFTFWDNEKKQFKYNPETVKKWMPVDWYVGGAEHAVLHLLYARFWMHVLNDMGEVNFREPFKRLRNVGMVLAEDHKKMSKSLGNTINPDDVVAEYGADSVRTYEMFMAPFNQEISWSTSALQGAYRFIKRVHNIYYGREHFTKNESNQDKDLVSKLQKTIEKVGKDISEVKFNTAIAAMMEFLNEWEKPISNGIASPDQTHQDRNDHTVSLRGTKDERHGNPVIGQLSVENAKKFLQILAPFAPYITEELWHDVMGERGSIHVSSWPKVNEKAKISEKVKIPVQVNGKMRGIVEIVGGDISKDTVVKKALEAETVKKFIGDKKYEVIYVEGKILNLVVE